MEGAQHDISQSFPAQNICSSVQKGKKSKLTISLSMNTAHIAASTPQVVAHEWGID